MTTITIENDIKLKKTNFVNIDDLIIYLLSFSSSPIEYEELSQEETQILNNLKSVSKFKDIVKNIKI